MKKNNGKTKRMIAIICAVLVIALVTTASVLFIPVGLDVDISAIKSVGNRVRVEKSTNSMPTCLSLVDSSGKPLDSPFKILSFTDTHLDTYRRKGYFTMEYLIENIQIEKPDLVVIVGDVVTSSMNRLRAKQFCEVMEKLEVYWIPVLGNHEGDNPLSISREDFIELYSSYPHCLVETQQFTQDGEIVWGYGNTQINVLRADGSIVQSLFFLDSGIEAGEEAAEKYGIPADDDDFIKPSQVNWYREQVSKLPADTLSMVFLHIPLPEYAEAYEAAPKTQEGALAIGVAGTDNTMAMLGDKRERICCSTHNGGLFDAIVELKSTQAVVVGHDHVNDFRILYKGVMLCYNRASGYSSYNVVTKGKADKLIQGASLYVIGADGAIEYGDIINGERFDDSAVYELYK